MTQCVIIRVTQCIMERRSFGMDTNTSLKEEDVQKDNGQKETVSFYRIVRRIMLAGVGAVAIKHDEFEEFIDKLVERGEIARKDGESLMKEMRERRSKYYENEMGNMHKRFNEFLDRFSVPTKKDLDELNEKLASLEKKIEELKKTKK